MTLQKSTGIAASLAVIGLAVLWAPAAARAQAAQDALAIFPADTQQFAYTNLSTLRDNPQFPLIEDRLLSPQLRTLQSALAPAGINVQKDVDQVVLGWRGATPNQADFFGIAEGSFDPETVENYFVTTKIPIQHYAGYELFGFGIGAARNDLFFAFLSGNEAAFGRFDDLKTMLDVHAGSKESLTSNQQFTDWENDLEGSAPQWGIATGSAAASVVVPLLTAGQTLPMNVDALFTPVEAVLYHVDWQSGIVAHLSIHCKSDQAAQGLDQLFTLLQHAPTGNGSVAAISMMRNAQLSVDGSKLSVDLTASISDLSQVLNSTPPTAQ